MVRLRSQPIPFGMTILVLIVVHNAGHAKQFMAGVVALWLELGVFE
jgi:hypothetical protein